MAALLRTSSSSLLSRQLSRRILSQSSFPALRSAQVYSNQSRTHITTTPGFLGDHAPIANIKRPTSPAYFTGNSPYNDLLVRIDQLAASLSPSIKPVNQSVSANLPSDDQLDLTKVYLSKENICLKFDLSLTPKQYMHLLSKLHTTLYPSASSNPEVQEFLSQFQRPPSESLLSLKTASLDQFGRAFATGGRKKSSSTVWVVRNTPELQDKLSNDREAKWDQDIYVNGKPLGEYFIRNSDVANVVYPLQAVQQLNEFKVWALVKGGGPSGQSQAIANALSKALIIHNAEWTPLFDELGLLKRDPRMVERKKPGQKKARKKFTWVKR
ncbi:ribosomal protein S9/S16-domain-containing protein [Paraphysoderma sedebokerense]|nr:ribosomal protein S9/S16-domain-containing protein [Paraphysoderma sedebokerense]